MKTIVKAIEKPFKTLVFISSKSFELASEVNGSLTACFKNNEEETTEVGLQIKSINDIVEKNDKHPIETTSVAILAHASYQEKPLDPVNIH